MRFTRVRKLVGRVHAVEVLSRDAEEHGQSGAAPDEDRVEALLAQELGHGDELPDHRVGLDLDAEDLEHLDLSRHDVLGQAELGDAVGEHGRRKRAATRRR